MPSLMAEVETFETPQTFFTLSQFTTEELGGKNMINSVNVPAQTILTQGIALFAVDRNRTRRGNACCGGWLFHDLGSGQFTIVNNNCDCDFFEVQFNANLTSATVGALAIVLQANGEAIGGTEMDYTPAAANVYESVSASTTIRVPRGASVTVSVKNISASSVLLKDANIIIKKL